MTATRTLLQRDGQVIKGRYRIDHALHYGAQSTVYAGADLKSGRIAIKVLEGKRDASLLRNSYLANAVGHPSAVSVHDTGSTEDGSVFLVMELVEATSMRELMRQHDGHLPVRLACTIADQGLDLLACAHAQRITHGEIELDKLFFTRTERLKLLGFDRPQSSALSASEQVSALTDDVRDLSKAIAWLLCGKPVAALPTAEADATSAPLPARIASVIQRGLSADPAQKWKSADAMRTALQLACKAELGRPIDNSLRPQPQRRPLPTRPRTRPPRSTSARGVWLAAAGVLLVALYVSRELRQLKQVPAPEPESAVSAAMQLPQASVQAEQPAPDLGAAPAAGQAAGAIHTDVDSQSADQAATPAKRTVPRKPPIPQLRTPAKRPPSLPSNIAPASQLCAQLSTTRRARQLTDQETQVYLAQCAAKR